MGLSFKEQLSAIPVPRLTTVVRVNLTLKDDPYSFYKAAQVILDWWNEKAKPYDAGIGPETQTLNFSRSLFKVDFARTEGAFAIAMEEPDSTVPTRSWIIDVGLKELNGKTEFGLRASFRQSHSAMNLPEPRTPRFLRQILDEIGAVDDWELKPTYQIVDEDAAELLRLVESPSRRLPVVVVSEEPETGMFLTDPERLSRFLAGTAHVFIMKAGASWELTRSWGSAWSVFQGAVRCYNPGFDRSGDKFRHRLWLADTIQRLDAHTRHGFANAVTSHVFTQITAQFESLTLLSPSSIKREIDESSRAAAAVNVEDRETPAAPEIVRESQAPAQPVELPPTDEPVPAFIERRLKNIELLDRIVALEESSVKLERDLQEERAARAATESKLSDAQAVLDMFEEENVRLEREQAIAFGDANREPSESLRPLWEHFSRLFDAMQTTAIKFRRMEQDADKIEELEQERSELKQELLNKTATIESLKKRLNKVNDDPSLHDDFRNGMISFLPRAVAGKLQLRDVLQMTAITFPHRVVILDSAWDSAGDSNTFSHVSQAFELLWTLATDYWEQLSYKGDLEARKVFGKSYASNEGENLSNAGLKRRTFQYRGQNVEMLKHLKVGTAPNQSDTLRIHFEWFSEEGQIVIGHCGRHLDP